MLRVLLVQPPHRDTFGYSMPPLGPLHLGEISGLCTSIMVFTSAIGPALFAIGQDLSGSYLLTEVLCLAGLLVLLIGAVLIRHPNERVQHHG